MITWLDFKIFGNGQGLGAPFWSSVFYWLIDQKTDDGAFYTWSGWFGSQLQSIQWTHPNAGERRTLKGLEFRPLHSSRSLLRVRIAWTCDALKTTEQIMAFKNSLLFSTSRYR